MYKYELHQDGYYIHKFGGGIVMREEMIFREEQEADFIYQVARWVKGEGYEVLYYTGSKGDASRVYDLTLALDTLSSLTKESK